MILGKKFRLHPTKEQEEKLWKAVDTARYVYNWTLSRQENSYRNNCGFISNNELRKEITQLKKGELSWLNDVSNNVAKQAVKDACEAYTRFFRGLSKKPTFKKKKRSKKSFYHDNGKLKAKEGNLVKIEKIGWIKTNTQVPLSVKYYDPRITHDGKYWYISLGIDNDCNKENQEDLTDISLGIDLGIKDLAICSNGLIFKNINKTQKVKKIEKKIKRLQRKTSKKYEKNKEGEIYVKTKNIIKMEEQIKINYRKLNNIRRNYLHQTTTSIVKTKPYRIVMEDIKVSNLIKNRYLSKSIKNQWFYEFKRQIKYKCELRGIEFILADRFFPSSKTCSSCEKIKKDLKLSDRIYSCECGLSIDRDLNASINLSNYKLA